MNEQSEARFAAIKEKIERLEALQGIVVGVELEMKKLQRFVAALSETSDLRNKILTDRCLELSGRVHKLESVLRSYGITEVFESTE